MFNRTTNKTSTGLGAVLITVSWLETWGVQALMAMHRYTANLTLHLAFKRSVSAAQWLLWAGLSSACLMAVAKAETGPANGPAVAMTMGMTVLSSTAGGGSVTVFYPAIGAAAEVKRGPFTLQLAQGSAPVSGDQRLVVFSHGSGGAPWPMVDLARSFINAGYVVAMPEHTGDNYKDMHKVGPASWKLRPGEVSQAIDAVQQDRRFAGLIDFDRVGVYGTSAGGLTALVLAGGKWSPANFKRYCASHMVDDFPACVGLAAQLKGNWGDAIKVTLARWVHRFYFGDETLYGHQDPRIKAVLAAVPTAAPIDLTTLAKPAVATGLIGAGRDLWLAPEHHVRAIQAVCTVCTMVLDLPEAGHGSLLSPWPQGLAQILTPLLVDPPGFVRDDLPLHYKKMVAFFTAPLQLAQ